MDNVLDHVWGEKYRPKSAEELITTKEIKAFVDGMISKGVVPNSLFVGRPGIGKTSLARLILDVLGFEYIIINGSLNGNIDTLRNEITRFASTISLTGQRKYVIIDEADYLNPTSTQPALRNFIETFAGNCGFIFTANYENKIIEPLRDGGRLAVVRFIVPKSQYPKLALEFTRRLEFILKEEHVEYDFDVLAKVVMMNMPNWRKIITMVQHYVTQNGAIDTGILGSTRKVEVNNLVQPLLVNKDFTAVRKWVADNAENDTTVIYTTLAETLPDHVAEQSVGDLIITIAKYQYQAAFVADQQVNLAACLAEIMVTCLAK